MNTQPTTVVSSRVTLTRRSLAAAGALGLAAGAWFAGGAFDTAARAQHAPGGAGQARPPQAVLGEPAGAPAAPRGALELLTPQNSALVLIDHQPQMFFGVQSHDRGMILNNTTGLAKAAKVFSVPAVLTTVAAETFSGPLMAPVQEVFPSQVPIDRTSMNSWDSQEFRRAVEETGRKKIVMAALWTEVCATMPALEMLDEGYEIYIVTDASGGTSLEAHEMAVDRMVQAGAVPVTWQQVMLEWQRDWANQGTYVAVNEVIQEHSGAYGMGVGYAKKMFGGGEGQTSGAD